MNEHMNLWLPVNLEHSSSFMLIITTGTIRSCCLVEVAKVTAEETSDISSFGYGGPLKHQIFLKKCFEISPEL